MMKESGLTPSLPKLPRLSHQVFLQFLSVCIKCLTCRSARDQNDDMDNQFNKIKNQLTFHREQLCQLGGYHLAIFGSIARNEATDASDVDILVDFDSKKGLFGFADLKFYLEEF